VHPDARVLNVMFAGEVARASELSVCQVMNRVVSINHTLEIGDD